VIVSFSFQTISLPHVVVDSPNYVAPTIPYLIFGLPVSIDAWFGEFKGLFRFFLQFGLLQSLWTIPTYRLSPSAVCIWGLAAAYLVFQVCWYRN